ncbi:MAG: hypothetical protein AAGJ37_02605 [Pseudomonadota bacterium]
MADNKKTHKKADSKGMLPDGHIQRVESYFRADHAIFASNRYLGLTTTQRALFWDLCAQFNGRNNGDLALNNTFCKEFGWDYGTVKKNRGALVKSGLVYIAGEKPLNNYKMMKLYALAFRDLNEDCNEYITEGAKRKQTINLKFEGV